MPQSRTAVPDRRNAQKPRTRHARGASQADLSPAARVYTAVAVAVCPPSSPSDSGWAGGRCIAPPYPTSPEVQPPNRDEVARAGGLRLLDTIKRYSKALEYEYRVKTVVLDTLKRYSILSLTLYLE
jgi:hypothetical protein